MRSALIMLPLLLILTPTLAQAEPHVRAMVGGSGAFTASQPATEDLTIGAAYQAEAEVWGKFLGIYARGQHLGLASNVDYVGSSASTGTITGQATREESVLIGPTLGFTAGPLRLRLAAGPVWISSNRVEGNAEEIQSGDAAMIYGHASSLGGGGELRADIDIPIVKPYAAVRALATSADATRIGGGEYDSMSSEDQEELKASVGNRQRVEAVAGIRFSIFPFLQLGLEGTYGFMGSDELEDQPWFGAGLGLHLLI